MADEQPAVPEAHTNGSTGPTGMSSGGEGAVLDWALEAANAAGPFHTLLGPLASVPPASQLLLSGLHHSW